MQLLLNNKTLELSAVPIKSNNGERNTIELQFDSSKYSFDEIYNLLSNADNTKSFTLKDMKTHLETDENGEEKEVVEENSYLYEYFSIVDSACIKRTKMYNANSNSQTGVKQCISITLAKLNETEINQQNIKNDIEKLKEQNIVLMEAVAEVYEAQLETV